MWHERERRGGVREWEREDGTVTVRLRERTGGGYVVRLDRLHQAPEGSGYRRERVDTATAARLLAAEWREEHDLPAE